MNISDKEVIRLAYLQLEMDELTKNLGRIDEQYRFKQTCATERLRGGYTPHAVEMTNMELKAASEWRDSEQAKVNETINKLRQEIGNVNLYQLVQRVVMNNYHDKRYKEVVDFIKLVTDKGLFGYGPTRMWTYEKLAHDKDSPYYVWRR